MRRRWSGGQIISRDEARRDRQCGGRANICHVGALSNPRDTMQGCNTASRLRRGMVMKNVDGMGLGSRVLGSGTHTRAPEPDAAYGRRCPAAIYGAKEPGKPTTCHVYVSEQARWFMLDDP